MKKIYQLRLTLAGQHQEESVILEEGDQSYIEHMMDWYTAHKRFFNGEFSITMEER